MDLFNFGFLTVRLLDIVDILLVAFLLYQLYNLIRGSVAINIFVGILLVYLLWLLVKALNMQLLGNILGQVIGVGVLALIIVFQQEIRKFLIFIGTNSILARGALGRQLFQWKWSLKSGQELNVTAILKACRQMARTKTGAIIVLGKSSPLNFFANTGDFLDAEVSKRLIENIFYKGSPLHDGAVIILENKIKAARCVLPISENQDLPARLGMRHKASIGITEQSDALAITVSEQTGEISVAQNGQMNMDVTIEELEKILNREFN
jgi:diadenylate cyclase